ncbi:hypothetical protein OTU49_017229 [Cherax quadricarinatus]|uniref:G-protein coupled receptors family 1 profile domain-containing protein n=1 Tax=Cherax quadricarinatus TaxID=27406 RepID=A0AAW0XND2_CHEQU|nr:protein trapped in endoderm-1-like isoform X2 [Cherax quadricarinatus]
MDFMEMNQDGAPSYSAAELNSALTHRMSGSNALQAFMPNLTTVLTTLATSTPLEGNIQAVTDALVPGNTQDVSPQYPYNMLGFTAASAFIISILGTFGNLLTIIALPMSKKLRTSATAFVVNLAVVELLFCVFILPMSGAQYLYLQQHSESLLTDRDCIFFTSVRYTLTQVELQTILAIALTRALAVSVPRLYASINRPIIMGSYIGGIWIYSLFLKLPPALGVMGQYEFNTDTMECDMGSASIKARYVYILVEAVIPVLLIFILYIFVFIMVVRRALLRQRKFNQNFPPPAAPAAKVKLSSARVARSSTRSGNTKIAPATSSTTSEKIKVTSPTSSTASTSSTCGVERKGSNSSFRSLKKLVSESSLRSRFTHQSSTVSQRLHTNRRDMRVARTIFIIFLLVLVCSVPVAVVHAVDRQVKYPVRFLLLHVLYWVQYCVNVVVYVLMNRQYRDAYVECLARVFPRFKAHHGRRFFWEKASISSKPQPNFNSSRPVNPVESFASETDPAAASAGAGGGPQSIAPQGRLTAIPEGHSSSAANDSVFSDAQKNTWENLPKENMKDEFNEGKGHVEREGCESDEDLNEDEALIEREHWVTQNGSTAVAPRVNEDKV